MESNKGTSIFKVKSLSGRTSYWSYDLFMKDSARLAFEMPDVKHRGLRVNAKKGAVWVGFDKPVPK